jgi:hypothetical protein
LTINTRALGCLRHGTDNGAKPPPQRVELQQKLQQTLGPIVFDAWQSGRAQKYDIQP